MIQIQYKGRTGNKMVQYAAGYILAKKTGLELNTRALLRGSVFNIKPIVPGVLNPVTIRLDDSNYYDHLNNPEPGTGYILRGFFQDGRLLCDYRDEILDLYRYDKEPEIDISPDDAYVACRLGDCLNNPRGRVYCTIEYIENQLKKTRQKYQNVYISSDSLDYPPLVELVNRYNMTIYNPSLHPVHTILFARNFNNLILSAGTFSYWIAYFSTADNVTVYKSRNDGLQKWRSAWLYNKNVKLIN